MQAKDWQLVCKSLGRQLNLEISLGILATTVLSLAGALPQPIWVSTARSVLAFLAAYYFVYSIILTKKLVDKNFK